jgi:hypothetical protein
MKLTIFSFLFKVSNYAFVFILHVPSLSCIGNHNYLYFLNFFHSVLLKYMCVHYISFRCILFFIY